MTAVRPDLPFMPAPAGAAAPNAGIKAAQAAFFRAALDRAQAPAASPASVQAQTLSPAEVQAQPIREQRPGALLDIRV
ncbi:MAG TPA: hypothetical protein PLQ03_10855 [Brevundimonas sp.]|uniref:hypothetical protein n=1 Tax=Brevundimonas sp. TaxID=1871086 RepID=UPI00263468E3|nr:hypothetical protein [Brevundimonas sp.]HRO33899.1 hypothetical protein [Brevundimonas sp.]